MFLSSSLGVRGAGYGLHAISPNRFDTIAALSTDKSVMTVLISPAPTARSATPHRQDEPPEESSKPISLEKPPPPKLNLQRRRSRHNHSDRKVAFNKSIPDAP